MGVSAVVYDCYYSTWEVVGRMKRDLKARMNYQKKKKKSWSRQYVMCPRMTWLPDPTQLRRGMAGVDWVFKGSHCPLDCDLCSAIGECLERGKRWTSTGTGWIRREEEQG